MISISKKMKKKLTSDKIGCDSVFSPRKADRRISVTVFRNLNNVSTESTFLRFLLITPLWRTSPRFSTDIKKTEPKGTYGPVELLTDLQILEAQTTSLANIPSSEKCGK